MVRVRAPGRVTRVGGVRHSLPALWWAAAVAIAGVVVELRWHDIHGDTEGAAQVPPHLIAWVGVLLLLLVAGDAVRYSVRGLGYRLVLAGALSYVPVATWHFVAHANGADPVAADVLIVLGYGLMLLGVVSATVGGWRDRSESRRDSLHRSA